MKRVALCSTSHGPYEDARARFKHQTLMQDYQELQKEAQTTRSKLEATKQRKLILLSEIRFLRRRRKFLLKNKAANPPPERAFFQQKNIEIQPKITPKEKNYNRKGAKLQHAATVFNVKQKERIFSMKHLALQIPSPILDLNHGDRMHVAKEAFTRNTTPVFDYLNQATYRNPLLRLNQKGRLSGGKETSSRSPTRALNVNQMDRTCIGREGAVQSHAPIFDLNKISEEEQLQDNEALREEPINFFVGIGTGGQLDDLKLSICRNVRNGPNQGGKRKISWQDPVALKV